MKSGSLFIILLAGTLLAISGCEVPPTLSSVPIIEYESLVYKDVPNQVDTLLLTIQFEDNEGDLGIHSANKNDNPTFYPTDASGNLITYGSSPDLPPYHVCDYVINPTINGVQYEDTILVMKDPNFNNIFVSFYKKVRGNFEYFDFKEQLPSNCFSFDGRFLRLNTQDVDRPLEGSLTYKMQSQMFGTIFRVTDTLKLEVKIRDNQFQESNVIETPEFTLEGIKAN